MMPLEITNHDRAVMHREGSLYLKMSMPLYVALRRYMKEMEEQSSSAEEVPEYLFAKAMMLNIEGWMEGETVSEEQFKSFEEAAEISFSLYDLLSESLISDEPAEPTETPT